TTGKRGLQSAGNLLHSGWLVKILGKLLENQGCSLRFTAHGSGLASNPARFLAPVAVLLPLISLHSRQTVQLSLVHFTRRKIFIIDSHRDATQRRNLPIKP